MLNIIKFIIWLLLTLGIWSWVGSLISAANTIAVIVGICVSLLWIVISVKTKCFIKKLI